MKKIFYLLASILITLGCNTPASQQGNEGTHTQERSPKDIAWADKVNQRQGFNPANLNMELNAEKILGEQVQLTDSSTTTRGDTLEYRWSYAAISKDEQTGKTGNVYFLIERYASVSVAEKVYLAFKEGNENQGGFKVITDTGDEAYFESDRENFYFILVRKENKMLRIKVNKITSRTSWKWLFMVAKDIIAVL